LKIAIFAYYILILCPERRNA